LAGGMVIYWFTGASIQAVTVGAYRAVEYIKKHIHLDEKADQKASVETSKEVVKICTQYAQKGMLNIFAVVFLTALGIAFISGARDLDAVNPAIRFGAISFFVYYLIAIAFFGLFQAIFMANAGGAWDNAKKVVEVDLKEKGTDLHAAVVTGDTVGDPFKDTSSVAMNPIIKFTTLFGLLAMEIAINEEFYKIAPYIGAGLILIALFFVYRSFYGMRIKKNK
jgi:K(+)-stimulated pyrophosphate-energized sodium pump